MGKVRSTGGTGRLAAVLIVAGAITAGGLLATGSAAAAESRPGAFSVELGLSAKAADRLARLKEGIVIAAFYYGVPAKAFAKKANSEGQIDLGQARVTIDGAARKAAFDGKAVKQDRVAWVDGGPRVLLNVYSARRAGPDNILDCGIFDDTLALAAKAPVRIDCKLIGE